ncbi:unnamed protein product [Effrenium voratum]|nr:unnamed protein product [Effrenium voratum]
MSGAAGAVVGARRHHSSQKSLSRQPTISQVNGLEHELSLSDAPVVQVYNQEEPSIYKQLRVPRAFRSGADSTKACTFEALQRWLSKQLQSDVIEIGVVHESLGKDSRS